MSQFLLILREDPAVFADVSPEQMQAIIARYSAWAASISAAGTLVGSNKLKDGEGRVLRRGDSGLRVLDGPFSEGKEVVGGYFLIQAADYDAALQVARACPHAEYGSIEVRAVDQV